MSKQKIYLDEFNKLEIEVDSLAENVLKKTGYYAMSEVRRLSPRGHNNRPHKYAETWFCDIDLYKMTATVYNSNNYRLAHLLEFGHFNVNGKGGLKWVQPQYHVGEAAEEASDFCENELKNANLQVEFK